MEDEGKAHRLALILPVAYGGDGLFLCILQ